MAKVYNQSRFEANVNGELVIFKAWSTDTRMGYCETVRCITHNMSDSKVSWCGRDWQRFDYESALKKAIAKLPKDLQGEVYAQLIDRKAKAESEKAEAMFQNFKKIHDACSPRQKEMLANSNIVMNSEKDVKAVEGLMLMGQLLGI